MHFGVRSRGKSGCGSADFVAGRAESSQCSGCLAVDMEIGDVAFPPFVVY